MPTPRLWRKLDVMPQREQQKFVERYADNFYFVPVKGFGDVEEGSHLRVKGSSNATFGYYHHFICIRKALGKITVMEYSGPSSGSINPSKSSVSSDCGKVAGTIKSREMSIQDLEEQQIEKVIWPAELKRYSGADVPARAQEREKEGEYDLLDNNCEHFASWCICGLNVSLQVRSWYKVVKEVLASLVAAVLNGLTGKIPFIANVIDEIFCSIGLPTDLAFATSVAIESVYAINQIIRAIMQYGKGIRIKTVPQLLAKISEIIAKSAGRAGLGIIGSLWGPGLFGLLTTWCPWFAVPAVATSLVGGAVGAGLGHLAGVAIGYAAEQLAWAIDNSEYFDG